MLLYTLNRYQIYTTCARTSQRIVYAISLARPQPRCASFRKMSASGRDPVPCSCPLLSCAKRTNEHTSHSTGVVKDFCSCAPQEDHTVITNSCGKEGKATRLQGTSGAAVLATSLKKPNCIFKNLAGGAHLRYFTTVVLSTGRARFEKREPRDSTHVRDRLSDVFRAKAVNK